MILNSSCKSQLVQQIATQVKNIDQQKRKTLILTIWVIYEEAHSFRFFLKTLASFKTSMHSKLIKLRIIIISKLSSDLIQK